MDDMELLADAVGMMADYLGRTLDAQETRTAQLHLYQTANMVREYTRGAGFNPEFSEVATPLMAIIVSRAARSMANPTDLTSWSASGISQRPGRIDWTLAEIRVMDSYRRQAGSLTA